MRKPRRGTWPCDYFAQFHSHVIEYYMAKIRGWWKRWVIDDYPYDDD